MDLVVFNLFYYISRAKNYSDEIGPIMLIDVQSFSNSSRQGM